MMAHGLPRVLIIVDSLLWAARAVVRTDAVARPLGDTRQYSASLIATSHINKHKINS